MAGGAGEKGMGARRSKAGARWMERWMEWSAVQSMEHRQSSAGFRDVGSGQIRSGAGVAAMRVGRRSTAPLGPLPPPTAWGRCF